MREYTQGDWVTIHDATWRRWLAPWMGQSGIRGLEIGACEGRSTCWFVDNVLTGRNSWLTVVDPWTGPYSNNGIYNRWQRNTAGMRVDHYRLSSEESLPGLYVAGKRFDFAYVDGSHEACDCLSDMCAVWALLKPGGCMIVDDYGWCDPSVTLPPKPAIDGWLAVNRHRVARWEISEVQGPQFAAWKPG
jgi:predicted O-methyltransferase YrrM